jgi:hypothetical protein
MSTKLESLETFYVIDVCAEYISGKIFLRDYIDPCMIEKILQANASFPCNTSSDMYVYTLNPEVREKSEWESIVFLSKECLQEQRTQVTYHGPGGWVNGVFTGKTSEKTIPAPQSIYNYLFGEGGDYEGVSLKEWSSGAAYCVWGGEYDDRVSRALSEFQANQPCQEDIEQYKNLMRKLGV